MTASGELRARPGDLTPLAMFDETVSELGERPLLHSHLAPIAAEELRSLADGLACGLAAGGVGAGDRVGLFMQNDPQFVLAMLACWRLGAIAVPCNPMLRERELAHHLDDAEASALVTLDELYESVAREAVAAVPRIGRVLCSAPCDPHAQLALTPRDSAPAGSEDLIALAQAHAGERPDAPAVGPDDVAVLTYTSGTTGPPKGAMNTHGNIAHASRIYRDCLAVDARDTILGIAPLYHVTGLTGHIGLALASGASLVLAHRFDPLAAARLAERHRASVVIAAITAYVAIAADERACACDLSSLRLAYSGGAPIPPSLVDYLAQRLGVAIRPVYGLTETTGPTNLAPPDTAAPFDPGTGALAVGLSAPLTEVRILDDADAALGPGEVGEVVVRGPQVVPGYWRDPQEARGTIVDGALRTGDVGVLDEHGWLYLVDRRKDMIVASGFKVWPREVEDVLYEHPAVREAAVIGVADDYRGETVWGYVSLKPGAQAQPHELVEHCRARLAAYKYPRVVHVLADLPKTASGKILRRELRPPA